MEEFLKLMNSSEKRLARNIGALSKLINEIVLGKRTITEEVN